MITSFLVILLCAIVLSAWGEREVAGRAWTPAGSPLGNAVVALNGGEFIATTALDGSFSFFSVPNGIYVCDVLSDQFHFPQTKLKVEAENVSVAEYKFQGAPRQSGAYPLSLVALAPMQHEVVKPPFSLLGFLFQNPMILLMLFSFAMMAAMPKLMANMTPEELAEMQQRTAANGDPMKNLSKLMGVPAKGADDDDD